MNRSPSFIFFGLLLVALAALFVLGYQIRFFSPACPICLALQRNFRPLWWLAR